MHDHFIRRCLELAEEGRGNVSPNPMVGCVIVQGGAIVTEGTHRSFGGAHAEREALIKAGDLTREATLYVNLEPCCKKGKQPPCTSAIIKSGIKTVVFGAYDPSNKGIEVLRSKGIEVIGPVLEAECRRINKGFFSVVENDRPWVTVKKAMRRDGSTDGKITTPEQDEWSHQRLRATHDAILVGSGTVVADDPKLTVRGSGSGRGPGPGRGPRRIILDPNSEVSSDATVLTDSDSAQTLVIREKLPIPELLQKLKEEDITSVLVEGGPTVWKSFEESGLVDEEVVLIDM